VIQTIKAESSHYCRSPTFLPPQFTVIYSFSLCC